MGRDPVLRTNRLSRHGWLMFGLVGLALIGFLHFGVGCATGTGTPIESNDDAADGIDDSGDAAPPSGNPADDEPSPPDDAPDPDVPVDDSDTDPPATQPEPDDAPPADNPDVPMTPDPEPAPTPSPGPAPGPGPNPSPLDGGACCSISGDTLDTLCEDVPDEDGCPSDQDQVYHPGDTCDDASLECDVGACCTAILGRQVCRVLTRIDCELLDAQELADATFFDGQSCCDDALVAACGPNPRCQ
jgi:hypothetical protein